MRFKTKPEVIEAFYIDEDFVHNLSKNPETLDPSAVDAYNNGLIFFSPEFGKMKMYCKTLHGRAQVGAGDYVILNGEACYPCHESIFNEKYEVDSI